MVETTSSKHHQPQFWTSLSLALLAASAFLFTLILASCRKSYSSDHYLRLEQVLGNVWDEGLLGPLGHPLMMQQDNIMMMLTTTALVLIVALIDFRISNRNDGGCDR